MGLDFERFCEILNFPQKYSNNILNRIYSLKVVVGDKISFEI